jgi:alginate O-acetyltransferase complex protein AlgI
MRRRYQNVFLVLASWFFYAFWDWRFLGLVILATLSNFWCGAMIGRSGPAARRKAWLILSLIINLGILGYFKYAHFFMDNFVSMANSIGWHVSGVTLRVILPIGISFYVFQSLSYPLDIYGGRLKPTKSLIDFAAFVAFFPKVVAGPIVRAREFLPQLEKERVLRGEDIQDGCIRLLTGFFKKVFIADTLALYLVNPIFADPGAHSTSMLWLATIGYTIQIYADFSGYSNMAIGSARIMGLRIPENFIYPYLAVNLSEFWRRWHVTMSTFFRDYLYIPMGGSRCSELRRFFNTMATMLICGLWHGATWNFVAWGGVHGLYLAGQHLLIKKPDKPKDEARGLSSLALVVCGWSITQILICLSMILVRAPDLATTGAFLSGLFWGGGSEQISIQPIVWLCFGAAFIDHFFGWLREHDAQLIERVPAMAHAVVYVAMIVFLFYAAPEGGDTFIYFQF